LLNRQAQPSTTVFTGYWAYLIKRSKTLAISLGNANTGVAEFQLNIIALMTSAHPNLTASRGELDTVVQQINHNLLAKRLARNS